MAGYIAIRISHVEERAAAVAIDRIISLHL
jgi:hypothetical protein